MGLAVGDSKWRRVPSDLDSHKAAFPVEGLDRGSWIAGLAGPGQVIQDHGRLPASHAQRIQCADLGGGPGALVGLSRPIGDQLLE